MDWRAIILAAGRGPDDPMAKAFGVAHKCTIAVAGKPMLAHVLTALAVSPIKKPVVISIDDPAAIAGIARDAKILKSKDSAPASALDAITSIGSYPVLVTTGDHPLLTAEMISHMMRKSETSGSDVLIGLATAETIFAAYPETKRTWFNLGGTRVSGCNLFAVMNENGLRLLDTWQHLEQKRKQPWKLVFAFGLRPLWLFVTGKLTPWRAFNHVSEKLGIKANPIFLPFAEAAIDVDKPSDHALAEAILNKRSAPA